MHTTEMINKFKLLVGKLGTPHISRILTGNIKMDLQYRKMKHQLDATLCRFYFCRVALHVSGASDHHQEYLKLVHRPLVHVLALQVSHHISLLEPEFRP